MADRPEVLAAEAHQQAVWDQWHDLNEQHYGWRMEQPTACCTRYG